VLRVALALGFVVACGSAKTSHVPAEVLPYDRGFVASSHRLLATLRRDAIELDTQPVMRTCEVATADRDCARCDVATVLDQIDPELVDRMAIAFARYPTSVRKAARLEHVAFCRAITYERGTDHGPAGLADPNTHRVYISVQYFRDASAGFSIEAAVHHEVFHLLDFATMGARALADTEWQKLNPAGFAYRGPHQETKRPAGFVNTYALTNEVEDRASTFEYLMVRPDELCTMTASDPILARKVRLLWQRLQQVEGADKLGISAPCAAKPTKPTKSTKPEPTKPGHRRATKRPLKLRL
jgi:hypothetical protein